MTSKGRHASKKPPELTTSEPGKDVAPRSTPVRKESKVQNFFSIYANDIQFQTTPWDCRLVFSELVVLDEPPILDVRQLGEIRISPQLAKKVVEILVRQLTQYEEKFGVIPGPRD